MQTTKADYPVFGSMLPPRFLANLRRVAGCDTITVYLSDPSALFHRSSYIHVGSLGILPHYAPLMRGPLKPESVEFFSAHDNLPDHYVEQLDQDARYANSGFFRNHRHASLIRLSIRMEASAGTPAANPSTPARRLHRLPPFLEVFVNYDARVPRAQLERRGKQIRRFLEERVAKIRSYTGISQLLNRRAVAQKSRRLDEIANRLAEVCVFSSPYRKVRQEVMNGFRELGQFILETCGNLARNQSTVSFHLAQFWGAGGDDCEPTIIAAYPDVRVDRLKRVLAKQPDRGIVRYVAGDRSSVILDCVETAPAPWRDRHIEGFHRGLSVTVPLFAGSRVACIVNIESNTVGLSDLSCATLCRMLPQIERLVRDLLAHSAQADSLLTREVLRHLNSLPFAPRELAVLKRLELLGKHLSAADVTYIEWDQGREFRENWSSRDEGPRSRHLQVGRALVDYFETDPSCRALGVERLGADMRIARVSPYRVMSAGHEPRVQRASPDAETIRRLFPEDAGARGPQPVAAADEDYGEDLVLPLWQVGSPQEREVKALLVISHRNTRFSLTPLRVENLNSMAQSFAHAILSISNDARRGRLHDWAAAGVGPLHDLMTVVMNTQEKYEEAAESAEKRQRVVDGLQVIRQQLWLWHQFSSPELQKIDFGDDRTTLGEMLDEVVRQAMIMAGKSARPPIRISARDRAFEVAAGKSSSVTAVLSNALSNSLKWGVGIHSVEAGVDTERGEIHISVTNRANRRVMEERLHLAVTIAREVAAGKSTEILENIAERRSADGLRGLGTWVAGRVTRDLLGGRYFVDFREIPGDPRSLMVVATVRFPSHAEPQPDRRNEAAPDP